MPRLLLSTVGTSLLTNGAPGELTKILRAQANSSEKDLSAGDRTLIDQRIAEVRQALQTASVPMRQELGAELNGLHKYCGPRLLTTPPDLHFLLATDTYQGQATARLIKEILLQEGVMVEVFVPTGLSTRSQRDFAHGIREVIKWCDDTLQGYRLANYHVVFNLVGSFKSLQGYLNTIGMFYADEIIYIFEDPSSSLIRIPRLPIRLDLDWLVEVREQFALLAQGQIVGAKQLKNWPETFYEADEQGDAVLSDWGLLTWNKSKRDLLKDSLLNLPHLNYAKSFLQDFSDHANWENRVRLQETLARVSLRLIESKGDTARLKRDGGIQYDNYTGKFASIGHFRVSQGLRVSCRANQGELELLHFGEHDYVNDRPV